MKRRASILNKLPAPGIIALFFFLILAVYSNTFTAAWQFDDKPNIIDNPYLHLTNLKPESLIQTLFTDPHTPGVAGQKLYRPLAYLTFAVNWYFAKDNVVQYHVVNFVIHFLTTVFLYFTALNILQTPNLSDRFDRGEHLIAFLASLLWAVNPIQTQAVTYIVQRMACMAALFYILSVLFYVKFRRGNSALQRIYFLLGCTLSFLLALGSKENAVTLPAALLLIEIICYQNINWRLRKKVYLWWGIVGVALISVYIIWVFRQELLFSFLGGYQNRPFTISERLLTEPRILLYYLSQIFYPIPARLSIEHDVVISTSLTQPWNTLPAILLCLFLIGLGFSQIRKRPLMALAILFFFLNHIIESTVIPLELIFEHRNYLPSLFLFLPVAAAFKWLYDYCSVRNERLKTTLAVFMALTIGSMCAATYMRNSAWATEFSLWQDAMYKAPASARPLTNIAWQLAYGPNARPSQFDTAIKLYQRALLLQKPRSFSESVILNNIAGIYFRRGENQKAIDLLEKALAISPDYNRGRSDLTNILIASGRWDAAVVHADYLLAKNDTHEGYLNLKGLILLHQKKYDEAIAAFRRAFSIAPFFKRTLLNLGVAYSLQGDYRSADIYFARAIKLPPKNIIPFLGLIGTRLKAGDFKGAQKYAGILLDSFDTAVVKDQLKNFANDHLTSFISADSISSVIEGQWADNSEDPRKNAN